MGGTGVGPGGLGTAGMGGFAGGFGPAPGQLPPGLSASPGYGQLPSDLAAPAVLPPGFGQLPPGLSAPAVMPPGFGQQLNPVNMYGAPAQPFMQPPRRAPMFMKMANPNTGVIERMRVPSTIGGIQNRDAVAYRSGGIAGLLPTAR
jgi:hypothetical protein